MKDNEIIETWQKIQDILKRTEIVVLQKDAIDDLVRHITNILDLINRLQAEIKHLDDENSILSADVDALNGFLEIAKAEAYKECIDKIQNQIKNNNAISAEWLRGFLDNLLKELVGEDNAKDND